MGAWAWSSGEPWGYVGPDATFPNNGGPPGTDENRLHYIDFVRKWNDLPEDGSPENGGGVRAFVVEWSADCNSDGTVDYGQIRAGLLPDENGNNIPDACECAQHPDLGACCVGDIVRDSRIDGADLAAVLSHWGPVTNNSVSIACDLDRSGTVDGNDLGILLAHWGPCAP